MNENELEKLKKVIRDQNYNDKNNANIELVALDNIISYDTDEKNEKLINLSKNLLGFYNDDKISLKSKMLSDLGLSDNATKEDVIKYYKDKIDEVNVLKSKCLLKNRYKRLDDKIDELKAEKDLLLGNFDDKVSSKDVKMDYVRMRFASYYEEIREDMAILRYLLNFADSYQKKHMKDNSHQADVEVFSKFAKLYRQKLDVLNEDLVDRLELDPLVGDVKCNCTIEVDQNKLLLYFNTYNQENAVTYGKYKTDNGKSKPVPYFALNLNRVNDKVLDKLLEKYINYISTSKHTNLQAYADSLKDGNISLRFGNNRQAVNMKDFGKTIINVINRKKDNVDSQTNTNKDNQVPAVDKDAKENEDKSSKEKKEEKKYLDDISKAIEKETENIVPESKQENTVKEVKKEEKKENTDEKVVSSRKASEKKVKEGKKKGIKAFFGCLGNMLRIKTIKHKINSALKESSIDAKLFSKDSVMVIRRKDGSLLSGDEKKKINDYLNTEFNYDKNVKRIRGGEGRPPLVTVDHINNAFITKKGINLLEKDNVEAIHDDTQVEKQHDNSHVVKQNNNSQTENKHDNTQNVKQADNSQTEKTRVHYVPKNPISKNNNTTPKSTTYNLNRERKIALVSHDLFDNYNSLFDRPVNEIMDAYREDNPDSELDDSGLRRAVDVAINEYNRYMNRTNSQGYARTR